MPVTENEKKYHEKMFPGYKSDFLRTDPEFIERFDNFAFDEVVNQEGQATSTTENRRELGSIFQSGNY